MALTSRIALFGWTNHLDSATSTLNEPGVAAGSALANLTTPSVWRRWVGASGQAAATLRLQRWDFGAAREIGAVAVVGYKPTAAGTQLRARAASVADFSSVLWTSAQGGYDDSLPGLVPLAPRAGRLWLAFPPAPVSARYFELGWLHDGSGDDHFEAAAVVVGPRWQPEEQFAPDWTPGAEALGERGHEVWQRSLKLRWHRLTPAELAELTSAMAFVRRTRPLVVVPRPLSAETWQHEALYARADEGSWEPSPWIASGTRWEVEQSFAEVVD